MMEQGVRIGVDVGGTFTDLVAWDPSGQMAACKVPTASGNPADGVLDGLAALATETGPYASLAHGTTIVTNAIVEGRGAQVGFITTRGFRDVLEIARQNRTYLYRLDLPPKPEPLVPRRLRQEISERVGPDGTVLVPLALEQLGPIIEGFKREGVESVAVCLLHAYANPAHERALKLALVPHFPHVSISSEINAEFREYERSSTTVLNATVMPLAARYLDDLVFALGGKNAGKPLHMLHSAGGMMSVEAAKARPLAMAMSGPAAGVAAAAYVARRVGISNALAFDMGGTTTDVCLIARGRVETAAQRRLGGYPVRLPSVAVESIGAGGGSVAWTDPAGALKVGPRSAGAVPGPACYRLGGVEPTVTDANLLLGYLNPERVYGGSIHLDRDAAEAAVASLARRYGMSLLEAACGIVEVANASMIRALRLVSVQRGHDLREFALIAYGGAGPLHAGRLARELGISRVIVPSHSGTFSALGCLVSDLRYDAVQTYRASLDEWDGTGLEDRFRELEAQVVRPLLEEGHPRDQILLHRSMDIRYEGQNYELEIPLSDKRPEATRAAFEIKHRQLYGYATGEGIECVNIRCSAMASQERMDLPFHGRTGRAEAVAQQRAYFPERGTVSLPLYDRSALGVGHSLLGPALIEDAWSTILVFPGQQCHADPFGNLIIELR